MYPGIALLGILGGGYYSLVLFLGPGRLCVPRYGGVSSGSQGDCMCHIDVPP